MKSANTLVVTRVAERHWHALDDDQVVGRGDAAHRPDGRIFLGIDAWHDAVFDRLAVAMLADLPGPLHTVVDEADLDLLCRWERFGFGPRRREWEYVFPTDPRATGLDAAPLPPGMTVLGPGLPEPEPLSALDQVIRDEVEADTGWQQMPAEVLRPPSMDPSRYAVAASGSLYAGLVRVVPLPRQPRIGLIAVRSRFRRQGIARALLASVLASAFSRGVETASADVNQSNDAAVALFEGIGAHVSGSNLELVRRARGRA
jgi:ribosomal protein S18 acetylase RimI-like enzyme